MTTRRVTPAQRKALRPGSQYRLRRHAAGDQPRIRPVTQAEAESAFAITRDQLLEHGINPEEVLATTCKCCVVDPDDYGTPIPELWDRYLMWRILAGKDTHDDR